MKRLLIAVLWLALLGAGASAKWEGGLKEFPAGCTAEKSPIVELPTGGAGLQGIAHCKDGSLFIAVLYQSNGFVSDFGEIIKYKEAIAGIARVGKAMAGLVPKATAFFVVYPPGVEPLSGNEIGGFGLIEGKLMPVVIVNEDLQR